jgi:hypothetical protein
MSLSKTSYSVKPLKGNSLNVNSANIEEVSAKNLRVESLDSPFFSGDGVLSNILITNSVITNSILGLDSPNEANFTTLTTIQDVTMFSLGTSGNNVYWDALNGVYSVTGEFEVNGCSLLGNIEICNNNIRANNLNGDVNIYSNNLGNIFLRGNVIQSSTIGNYSTNTINGSTTIISRDNLQMTSSRENIIITSQKDQTYTTLNGNITLNTDTNFTGTKGVTLITNTNGNIKLTSFSHNLRTGDTISLASTLFNGNYTVGSIINFNEFIIGTTGSFSNITTATFSKYFNNDINLNASRFVNLKQNIPINFGFTTNNIYGNTRGIILNSIRDYQFLSNTINNIIQIPQTTFLQFGSSGNYIRNNTSNSIEFYATNNITIQSSTLNINSSNVSFYDPILSIASYTTGTNDLKDRGIEYKWYDTIDNTMKLGWFGFKNNSKLFTFIPDAINNDEIISGTPGDFQINSIQANTITLSNGGTLNANCGTLENVNTIIGCSGGFTLNSANRITFTTSSLNMYGSNLNINSGSFLNFGTSGALIVSPSNGSLGIVNSGVINISSNNIVLPVNSTLSFNNTTTNLSGSSTGNLTLTSPLNIILNLTNGNLIIPQNIKTIYGDSSILGNTSGIFIDSTNLNIAVFSSANITASLGNINFLSRNGIINLSSSNIQIPSQSFLNIGNNNTISSSGGSINFIGSTTSSLNLINYRFVNIPYTSYLSFGTFSNILNTSNNNLLIINTHGSLSLNSSILNISNSSSNIQSNIINITSQNISINSTSVNINGDILISDKNILLSANETLITQDNKDRGILFNYFSTSNLSGWFGYKNSSSSFSFYSNAINTNDIISGTLGSIESQNLLLRGSLIFSGTINNINLNCGDILNLKKISSCSGILDIDSSNSIRITTSNINIPFNCPILFGTNSSIKSTSTSGILINSFLTEFDSNVNILGGTTNIFSTNVSYVDPILTIGGITNPITNDLKDRGIEYRWHNGSSSKLGFFGYKNNLQRFVFIQEGVNTNEIFNGTLGNVQFNNGFFNNIDINNGAISNISNIISGTSGLTIQTSNSNLNIIMSTNGNSTINIPQNVRLLFNSTNSIFSNTSNQFIFQNTSNNILFNTYVSSGVILNTSYVNIPISSSLNLGNSSIMYNTSNNIIFNNSVGNINLTPKLNTGSINIPVNNLLQFGNSSNSIYSDNTQLYLNGYDGINLNSSSVTIAGNVIITGVLTADNIDIDFNQYILELGTIQTLAINDISNSSTIGKLLVSVSQPHYFTIGDSIIVKNTNSIPTINNEYIVQSIIDIDTFVINGSVSLSGNFGVVNGVLKINQNKDVGIKVNYWSTTGNFSSITSGSINYKTGFFGFENTTERWIFYNNAQITQNNILNGTLGNIQVNEIFSNFLNSTTLSGTLNANTRLLTGSNFDINGGEIDNTPIGINIASTGRFTNIANTVSANLTNLSLNSSINYSIDRYTLQSSVLDFRNPDNTKIVSLFNVNTDFYTVPSGTMNTLNVVDGSLKIITCSYMGFNSSYTLQFPANKLIAPNPLNPMSQASRIVFRYQGQSVQMVYSSIDDKWVLISCNAFVY